MIYLDFELKSDFKPTGDQPEAIKSIVRAINNNEKYSIANIRKEFTKLKKEEKFKWLNEVSSKVTQESIRNLDKAFKSFFNKQFKVS